MNETPSRWIWEKDLGDAAKALDVGLYGSAILSSFFAISGFIWDLLWGVKNTWVFFPPHPGGPRMVKGVGEVIFPSQTEGPCLLSSIDFVFNYVRPGPVMNQDIQLLRQANADLYARIRSAAI
jgi:hypothetical protein